MLFKATKNWKELLSIDDEEVLNELLKKAAKHRGAYKNADDVKIAQLWCASLELKKENVALNKRLKRIEYLLEGLFERNRKDERALLESLKQL